MRTTCPDLRTIAEANRFRWQRAEGSTPKSQDPWDVEIPCKGGVIYPQGAGKLAFMTTKRALIRICEGDSRLKLHQRGDSEASFTFDERHLLSLVSLLKVKRLRKVDPGAVERGKALAAGGRIGKQIGG